MSRHFETAALVIKASPQGEFHRLVTFFTPEKGLLTALAPGAAKPTGKLRFLTSPFALVQAKLYHDPVKDLWRVEDLEERALHRGLGEVLGRFTTASLWCEILLKSHGGGLTEGTFELVAEGLEALETASEPQVAVVKLAFLWKLMENWGWAVDPRSCGVCGRSVEGQAVFYSRRETQILCGRHGSSRDLAWEASVRDRLQDFLDRAWDEIPGMAVEPTVRRLLWDEALWTLRTHLGRDLKSLALDPD